MKLPALGPAGILSDFIYDFLAFSPKKNALLQESYTSNKIRAQLQVFRQAMEEAIPKGENSLGDDLFAIMNTLPGLFPDSAVLSIQSTRKQPTTVNGIVLKPDGMGYLGRRQSTSGEGNLPPDFQAVDLLFECKLKTNRDPFEFYHASVPSSEESSLGSDDSGAGSSESNTDSPPSSAQGSLEPESTSNSQDFIRARLSSQQVLGQIADYASGTFHADARTHVFVVVIFQGFVRITRWDHSCVVVSHTIHLVQDALLFATFLHAVAAASDASLGRDPTSELLSVLESETLIKEIRHERGRLDPRDPLRRYWDHIVHNTRLRLFKMTDPNGVVHELVMGPLPFYLAPTLNGRYTRGWPVWNRSLRLLQWLKVVWRVELPDIPQEGITYHRLRQVCDEHLPSVICHGDTASDEDVALDSVHPCKWQRSMAGHLIHRPLAWVDPVVLERLHPLRQYAILIKEVGIPLRRVKASKNVVLALLGAGKALVNGHDIGGTLHRDVSPNNILLGADPPDNPVSGLLIDWHLSRCIMAGECEAIHPPSRPRQIYRTGTWQFMSYVILANFPDHQHSLADDLESLFYALLWITLRYFRTNCRNPPGALRRMFDEVIIDDDDQVSGGLAKHSFILCGKMHGELTQLFSVHNNQPLTDLIHDLRKLFRRRYEEWGSFTVTGQDVIDALEQACNAPGWPSSEVDEREWKDCLKIKLKAPQGMHGQEND